MRKNFSLFLAVLSMGSMPMLGSAVMSNSDSQQQPPAQVKSIMIDQKLGQKAIASIRQAYEKGEYNKFLKEMNDSYREARDKNRLTDLASMRTGYSPEWQQWESKARALQDEKNKELIGAVDGQNETVFVQKVRSAGTSLTNEPLESAIEKIASFRQMPPGTGKNNEENLLIDLDLEYEYKALHLDLPGASPAELREKHCVLKMEKLDQMILFSKQFQDSTLKNDIAAYAENFDARLAQSWDTADLNDLANGKKKPENGLEEKVASILSIYQEKFSDLTREFVAQNDSK